MPCSGTGNIFVSFLIPVYNAERVLAVTLESIVQQDNGHIEIICVDDGSTDGSSEVLASYAARYPWISIISQDNQGITAARNAALVKASGDWICFVDDDDILAQDAVSVFQDTARNEADIVYYDYAKFTGDGPDQSGSQNCAVTWYSGERLAKLQSDCINRFAKNTPLISHKVLPTPWAKLYNRRFLFQHGLRFRPEVKHEEDVVFNFEVLGYCAKVEQVNYTAYYYRWSIASESHRYRPNIADDTQVTLAAYSDIIMRQYSKRPDISILYQYRVLWELLYCVILGPIHPMNKASYSERKQQFIELLDRPIFAEVVTNANVKMTRFEFKQSMLAVLVRSRRFWLLNLMRQIIGVSR